MRKIEAVLTGGMAAESCFNRAKTQTDKDKQ